MLTVSVPHGCDGSPTTEVTIQIPEQINAVTPTRNPLWEVDKQVEQLDPPVTDAHGNKITERVATVTYTAKTPLPDGYRDAFELSLQLPGPGGRDAGLPDDPDVRAGRVRLDRGPRGRSGASEELDLPAPSVTLTAAAEDSHADEETTVVQEAEPVDEDGNGLAAWALGRRHRRDPAGRRGSRPGTTASVSDAQRRLRRTWASALVAAVAAALVLVWSPAAFAHATLIDTDPDQGAVLDGGSGPHPVHLRRAGARGA